MLSISTGLRLADFNENKTGSLVSQTLGILKRGNAETFVEEEGRSRIAGCGMRDAEQPSTEMRRFWLTSSKAF
jgi:hypothetical protein